VSTQTRKARPPELAVDKPRFRLVPMWYRKASCPGFDWRLWFPVNPRSKQAKIASVVCESCPVRRWCAQDALNSEESCPESGVIRAGVYMPSPLKRGSDRLTQRASAIERLEQIAAGV